MYKASPAEYAKKEHITKVPIEKKIGTLERYIEKEIKKEKGNEINKAFKCCLVKILVFIVSPVY